MIITLLAEIMAYGALKLSGKSENAALVGPPQASPRLLPCWRVRRDGAQWFCEDIVLQKETAEQDREKADPKRRRRRRLVFPTSGRRLIEEGGLVSKLRLSCKI